MIGSQLMVWQSEGKASVPSYYCSQLSYSIVLCILVPQVVTTSADERMLSPSEKAMEALLSEVKELLIASLSRIKDLEGELLSREATDQLASLLMSTGEGPKSPAKKGRPSDVGE